VLLVAWAGGRIAGRVGTANDLQDFARSRSEAAVVQAPSAELDPAIGAPDVSSWSASRIRGYHESLTREAGEVVGVLRIPSVGLTAPVRDGVDEVTLNRAVGLVPGMARPGERGNVGIAGHRDGFFRALEGVGVGAVVELELLPAGTERYRVSSVEIVDPDELRVLAPTAEPRLTLVTCYPFRFVGSAPRRYIVRADLDGTGTGPEARRDGG